MNEPSDTPVPFPAKLRAAYKLTKLASNEDKKLVLETARKVMEEYASEGYPSISFDKLDRITNGKVKSSVRASSIMNAFAYVRAILISEGVPKDYSVGRGHYFYWSDSE